MLVFAEDRIRDFRIWARSETGKEPVVSIIVAFGVGGLVVGWERRMLVRRWSEIWVC